MPVDSKHDEYAKALTKWSRCRDAISGQDAVHAGGPRYLPKLSDQTADEYQAYKDRTPWYGATGRTLEGMVGMVFRVDPVLEAPDAFKALTKDITLSGVTLDGVAREGVAEVVGIGRYGLLVEFPKVAEQPTNLAAAAAANLRPYVRAYKAETITNWRIEMRGNRMQPTLVVLKESYEVPVDVYSSEVKTQYRVLMLDEAGRYVQRVFKENADKQWVAEPDIIPQMNGKALGEIPFYPFGPEKLSLDVQQAPILDLVDLNLSHYRTSADLEHGAHFTGLPTPFIAGVQLQGGEKVRIGSSEAIVANDPAATASYLEFSGQGLGALERLMDRKEGQMAALGARMLAPEKAGVESEGTMAMRHNGEDSVLAGIAKLFAFGITEMCAFMARWAGLSGTIKYTLNTDYLPRGMSAQELTALMSAWQQGGISFQTLFANLQRAEIIAPEVTDEEEQERIGDAGPTLAMQTALQPEPNPAGE